MGDTSAERLATSSLGSSIFRDSFPPGNASAHFSRSARKPGYEARLGLELPPTSASFEIARMGFIRQDLRSTDVVKRCQERKKIFKHQKKDFPD